MGITIGHPMADAFLSVASNSVRSIDTGEYSVSCDHLKPGKPMPKTETFEVTSDVADLIEIRNLDFKTHGWTGKFIVCEPCAAKIRQNLNRIGAIDVSQQVN
jgi:hypothetical protein